MDDTETFSFEWHKTAWIHYSFQCVVKMDWFGSLLGAQKMMLNKWANLKELWSAGCICSNRDIFSQKENINFEILDVRLMLFRSAMCFFLHQASDFKWDFFVLFHVCVEVIFAKLASYSLSIPGLFSSTCSELNFSFPSSMLAQSSCVMSFDDSRSVFIEYYTSANNITTSPRQIPCPYFRTNLAQNFSSLTNHPHLGCSDWYTE